MNAVWRQSQAKGRARLVLLAIADHQGEIGAWPSIATLARMVNSSERSVQRDIQELQDIGELEVHVQQAPSRGQYKSNLYWVTLPGVTRDEPGVTEIASGVTDSSSGVTKNSSGVTAGGVLTLIEPLQKPNRNTSSNKFDVEFNEFWNSYPRRVGKLAAQRAFAKAVKDTEPTVIIDGAAKFARDPNLPPVQFIPYPATWLGRAGWEDEPYPERQRTKEELEAIRAEKVARDREKALANTLRLRAETLEAEAKASPPPKCPHGASIVSCRQCLRNVASKS